MSSHGFGDDKEGREEERVWMNRREQDERMRGIRREEINLKDIETSQTHRPQSTLHPPATP